MGKAIVIDVSKCSGCYNCQLACKDEHVGNDWTPYAKPQPEIGQFWLKLQENVCGTIPKVKIHYIPKMCNHCRKANCLEACPNGAVSRRDDGFIEIAPEKCKGCKKCAKACPYEAIYWNEELKISQKCTGCAHLLDAGEKLPRCVEACPTDAMQFGDEDKLEDIEGATVMMPETGCLPRVYYRNIPGKFIAGTVYDPAAKEVVIGAKCRLTTGGRIWEAVTDNYGDFWFKDLAVGKYDLAIDAKGFESKYWQGLHTRDDINLGDIPLTK
ncbi:MAG: 4Fe-4S dicluster domain-containing protein [Oscillospiraceae bacterium]|nr:4Fe-4S dicluster domain-containing protein [Oscillospiraceae bacterium]